MPSLAIGIDARKGEEGARQFAASGQQIITTAQRVDAAMARINKSFVLSGSELQAVRHRLTATALGMDSAASMAKRLERANDELLRAQDRVFNATSRLSAGFAAQRARVVELQAQQAAHAANLGRTTAAATTAEAAVTKLSAAERQLGRAMDVSGNLVKGFFQSLAIAPVVALGSALATTAMKFIGFGESSDKAAEAQARLAEQMRKVQEQANRAASFNGPVPRSEAQLQREGRLELFRTLEDELRARPFDIDEQGRATPSSRSGFIAPSRVADIAKLTGLSFADLNVATGPGGGPRPAWSKAQSFRTDDVLQRVAAERQRIEEEDLRVARSEAAARAANVELSKRLLNQVVDPKAAGLPFPAVPTAAIGTLRSGYGIPELPFAGPLASNLPKLRPPKPEPTQFAREMAAALEAIRTGRTSFTDTSGPAQLFGSGLTDSQIGGAIPGGLTSNDIQLRALGTAGNPGILPRFASADRKTAAETAAEKATAKSDEAVASIQRQLELRQKLVGLSEQEAEHAKLIVELRERGATADEISAASRTLRGVQGAETSFRVQQEAAAAARDRAQRFGQVGSSAAEAAIFDGAGPRDIGIGIGREVFRELIGKQIAATIANTAATLANSTTIATSTAVDAGTDVAGAAATVAAVAGAMHGRALHSGGVFNFKSGGILTQPTTFIAGGTRVNTVEDGKPELVAPLKRAPNGDLGVTLVGGGGGGRGTVIHQSLQFNVTVGSAKDADAFRHSARQLMADARRQMGGR